ncbi:MAG TPA: glycosyltransferase family 9 protein [Bdellovibrionota bacterium]|nr:glycosyltransferase family 9 protein [Bdellovibrionota bacterium]
MRLSADARILVARPDRIGDVVLSTPALRALKKSYPRAHVTVAVRAAVAPLLRGLDCVDQILIFDPEGGHAGWSGRGRLISEIRAGKFDAAIVLQSHRRLSGAIWAARVPVRIGPLGKPHSYLFFNQGIRQKRSRVRMHEADYNLELLRPLGVEAKSREFGPRVVISEECKARAAEWMGGQMAKPSWGRGRCVAVHPGMGGSALNWPEERYCDLVGRLVRAGRRVVVTGGAGEAALVERVAGSSGAAIWIGDRGRGIDDLGALLAECGLMVAPSTGPLHVAVALGVPVVAFYPRIRVQSPERWGPYFAEGEGRAEVLAPPDERSPMDAISMDAALAAVEKLLPFGEE